MVKMKLGSQTIELATTLRVAFEMQKITGAKSVQAALNDMQSLGLEGQLSLMYAAYKAANRNVQIMSENDFKDKIQDNCGILTIAEVVNQITDGLLYAGMSPEEAAAKKIETEKLAGATSSVKDIE